MVWGTALIVVILLAALIWVFIEIKRVRHKFFAIFLIGLIIFAYITFTISLSGKDVDLGKPSGWVDAGKLYFSWLGSAFTKMKSVTMYAVGLDWKEYNETITPTEENENSVWNKL